MKMLLLTSLLFLSLNSFAKVGKMFDLNGIVVTDFELSFTDDQLGIMSNNLVKSLYLIFEKDQENLQSQFPEFKFMDLLKTMKDVKVEIVQETLIDKDGITRTCLNYPASLRIKCTSKELDKIKFHQQAYYLLILHEYLGIIGVEETSIDNLDYREGYSISSRFLIYFSAMRINELSFEKTSPLNKSNSIIKGLESSFQQDIISIINFRHHYGLPKLIPYASKRTLLKAALEVIKKKCDFNKRSISFIDGKVIDVKYERGDLKGVPKLVTSGDVAVRYICD